MTTQSVLENLTAKLPLGVCVLNDQMEVLYWNDFFADRLNISSDDVKGQNLLTLFPNEAKYLKKKINSVFVLNNASFSYWEHRPHVFLFSSSRPITGEETLMYQNIEFLPLDVTDNKVKTVCMIVQDVTELASYYQGQKELSEQLSQEHKALQELNRKLEEAQNQLLQADKMAAIGQLAAGVAHEINNPIGFINSNLQSLEDYAVKLLKLVNFYEKVVHKTQNKTFIALQKDMQERMKYQFIREDMPELVAESIDGINRVSEIVKSLKAFSHVDSSEWQYADIVEGIESTLKIANNELKYNVEIHREYQQQLPKLFCQPMQLNQVFLNLIVNGAQAIVDKGHIYITVSATDNDYQVAIKDTGCGISKSAMHKIFEPFYTTKPVGQGTGLGLSLSYSIVQKHKGNLVVTSEPNVGTTFTVILPILTPEQLLPEASAPA
ncbi:ATP-binding protein [Rheinheimera baltica]|uniref:ATP-binding protein n=1 Tax=Rheinheimera baltica TaxID=67576 RepID=UPI00273F22E2|nr:ATP-binding protein [Rheinheimera baltica]MDP5141481.1 ATP-binding protein [Rheinheimera baltica]